MNALLDIDFGLGRIRPWARSDRDALVRHANSPDVARYTSTRFPHPYTVEAADAWFDFLDGQDDPEAYAIEVDGEAMGGIGIRRGEGEYGHSGELGYWLGEAAWGRGIVTAAVQAFVPAMMARWHLSRVDAFVVTDNIASRRVLEKAGFALEGIQRARTIRGSWVQDHAMYGLVDPSRFPC
ncbi:MAG TPA: GNAT family N-acetyltransferase [Pseudomonas sp.]|nr:GNAT family N-acetyltransferase [Pseudomonas sp.]